MSKEIELKDEERQPCEVWTRIMGYHRPINYANPGKKAEFRERKLFVERPLAISNGSTTGFYFDGEEFVETKLPRYEQTKIYSTAQNCVKGVIKDVRENLDEKDKEQAQFLEKLEEKAKEFLKENKKKQEKLKGLGTSLSIALTAITAKAYAAANWADKPVEKIDELTSGLQLIGGGLLTAGIVWGAIMAIISPDKAPWKRILVMVGAGFVMTFGADTIAEFLR